MKNILKVFIATMLTFGFLQSFVLADETLVESDEVEALNYKIVNALVYYEIRFDTLIETSTQINERYQEIQYQEYAYSIGETHLGGKWAPFPLVYIDMYQVNWRYK
ncbi:hypothetical protein [Sporosarcina highlanderae]|uniref:Uncharacterized protein n=1 Tax=Sporosarcina highlanderae TaxID=3035916 RepID=A0ABT8JMS8_9BACL|nr:hypothetical protein [Sporosarcina highlanderae]MDN4606118.1 hypothetical protein [Sporosarcina highlanderae]